MAVYHDERRVLYFRPSPLQAEAFKRQPLGVQLKMRYVADPAQTGRCSRVGREQIADTWCDIWEGTAPYVTADASWQIRAWLEEGTGELMRLEMTLGSKDWERVKKCWARPAVRQLYEVLERGVPIPPERLSFEPPAGFKANNTKATAIPQKFAWGSISPQIRSAAVFSLLDGSLLMGWRLESPEAWRERKWAENYKRLQFGDPLPVPPSACEEYSELRKADSYLLYTIDLTDLWTVGLKPESRLRAYHVTTTEDESGVWEWSLHIPEDGPLDRSSFFCYKLSLPTAWTFQGGTLVDRDRVVSVVGSDLPILNEADYQRFVVGAMKEYAAREPDRPFPTYQQILKLVRSLYAADGQ